MRHVTDATLAMTLRNRVLRLFSAAIGDQMMLSAASFAVGLLLVRFTSDADYALYVLLQTALLLVVSIHSSLVGNPLAILSGSRTPADAQSLISTVRRRESRLLWPIFLLALLIPAVGFLAGLLPTSMAVFIALGILAAWATVRRDFTRNVLLIYARPRALLVTDVVYVLVLLGGILWAAFGFGPPAAWVAVALMLAAWACAAVGHRILAADPGWAATEVGSAWREMRSLGIWALTGSVIYWIFSRSYNYILVTRLNLTAVADVNAIRLMVMPAIMVAVGLQSVLTPLAAAWKSEVGLDRLVHRLLRILLVVAALDVTYFAALWPFRAWVTHDVFHKDIGNRDLLLVLWASFALVALARDVLAPAVYALGRLKWLAVQIGFCALIALSIMWFGIPRWGTAAALAALLIGELLNLAGIVYLVRKAQRDLRRAGAPGNAPIRGEPGAF